MEKLIGIIGALTPLGLGVCGLLGVGSVGKIILKIIEYKNDEKIRKEKHLSTINSNITFYKNCLTR